MCDEGGYVVTYEIWVKGELGIHKDKLILSSVHTNFLEAQNEMMKKLKSGEFATMSRKEVKIV